jgi:hypothetical protein
MASRTSSANDNIFGAQTGESGFRTKLREIFNRYQEQWELRGLGHDQMEAIARDTGIDVHDIYDAILDGSENGKQYLSMMQQYGISTRQAGGVSSPLMRDIIRVCAHCSSKSYCDNALAIGHAVHEADKFCPNAPVFDHLAGM